jgi:antirestriction protein ArdC
MEELVSELNSLYVAAETGIPNNPDQHAAYVASWLHLRRASLFQMLPIRSRGLSKSGA